MTQETPTEHSSLVGGSTASRRLNCPRSYHLEQKVPKSAGSIYAREGTALHEMIAQVLDKDKDPAGMLPFTHHQPEKGGEEAWEFTVDEVLWDRLGQPALDMFDSFLAELESDQEGAASNYMVEEKAEFPGITGAFGTSDVPFRCGEIGGIWDWKFGRNRVAAENNDQLMFYFAALHAKYPDYFKGVTRVMLCISQPQVNDQEPDVWETTLDVIEDFKLDLQETVTYILETNAETAEIKKGPWCKYADCKTICPLHINAAANLGEALAAVQKAKDPAVRANVDIDQLLAEAMDLAAMAEDWAKHVAGLTQERLEAGFKVPGFKLVAKKSSGREWAEPEEKVMQKLRTRGLKIDDYAPRKLITAPAAEKQLKALGKELWKDAATPKPSSGHTLTREGDPRPKVETGPEKAQALGAALLKKTKSL